MGLKLRGWGGHASSRRVARCPAYCILQEVAAARRHAPTTPPAPRLAAPARLPTPLQTLKLVFKLLPGLDANEQLEQLSQLAGSTHLTASAVSATNMRMSVAQLDNRMAPSRYRCCRVTERYNFARPTADLPKVIR